MTRGFPKGIKVNKTVPVLSEVIDNIHNRLREVTDKRGYKYHDIINELKIIDDDGYITVKVALHRNAILLSAESEEKESAQQMINEWEKIITEL